MADPGSVSYLFSRKGVVIVPATNLTEDDVLTAVLDAGAEEVNDLDESFEVVSEATDLVPVRQALQAAGICASVIGGFGFGGSGGGLGCRTASENQ